MKDSEYDYAVIGGDLRQVYLAEELVNLRNRVIYYALIKSPKQLPNTSFPTKTSSLETAIASARCIICPIPFSRDGLYLNQNAIEEPVPLDDLLDILKPEQAFFAGNIPAEFETTASKKGVFIYDFMKNNSLALFNTIATAEGAICEAIQKSPRNLHHSKCAVLGYGRCGRTITSYLKGTFCNVSVFSRDTDELALAGTIADNTISLCELKKHVNKFDFIFNTIPAKILTDNILHKTKPSVTIIDIASAPGGVDYEAAQKLGINASLCLGLPGKYSPYSCAKAIINVIENNLKE